MRESPAAVTDALVRAPHEGLVPLRFASFWPLDAIGQPVLCGFWSDPPPAAVAIANRSTGTLETRDFVGDAVLEWGKVRLTTGLEIVSWTIKLNALHPAVRQMLGYDLRLARVEYHRVPGDVRTRRPVGTPQRRFLGRVDTAPRPITGINSESGIEISCTSSLVDLTVTNPMKRSDVAQQRRSGDKQMQYVDVAGDWDIEWGQASGGST